MNPRLPNTAAGKGATARPVTKAPAKSGLGLRVLSALVLAPVVLAVTHFGGPYFEIMVGAGAGILAWELIRASAGNSRRVLWLVFGLAYIALACLSLVWVRFDGQFGREAAFGLFAVVWASDTGAYVFGRIIGGPKMAPVLSPKKTWAGLVGGITCAAAAAAVMAIWAGLEQITGPALAGGILGAVAQAGDLLESWAKRCFGVKDSGDIIPGHGGLFDRADGLLAAALAGAVILLADNYGVY